MDLNKRPNNGIKSLTKLLHNLDSLFMNMTSAYILRTLTMSMLFFIYM